MQNNLHPNIQALFQQWKQEEAEGVVVTNYEKLYHINLLYAEACSRYHFLEASRKHLKDKIYLKFKAMPEIKTDKMAEAMARTDDGYVHTIEEVRTAQKYYLQIKAEMYKLQGKMESEKSQEIASNIERRLSSTSGEGRY